MNLDLEVEKLLTKYNSLLKSGKRNSADLESEGYLKNLAIQNVVNTIWEQIIKDLSDLTDKIKHDYPVKKR